METKLTGKVIVVGNNIDTDQIYPGCYLALTDPEEIGSHCLEGVSKEIAVNMRRLRCLPWEQKLFWLILSPGSFSGMQSTLACCP